MTAPKQAKPRRATATKKTATTRHVPKGSYAHTASVDYIVARDQALVSARVMMKMRLAQLGVHAREVAEIMGLSLGVVRWRMQGKTPWGLGEIVGLCNVYGLDVADIIKSRFTVDEMRELMDFFGPDIVNVISQGRQHRQSA